MPTKPLASAISVALFGLMPLAAHAEAAACTDILPHPGATGSHTRPLTARDLVRLRDIGSDDHPTLDGRVIARSPDGSRIAFQLRQADPATNRYCMAMVVMGLRDAAMPVVVDRGGEPIRLQMAFRATPAFPTGILRTVVPQWSQDGGSVYFLKRTTAFAQVWKADAGGHGSAALTDVGFDIEDFVVRDAAGEIIFAGRPGIARALAAIDQESNAGFHYDDRYAPAASNRPFPAKPIEREVFALDLRSGALRQASDAETALLAARDADPGTTRAPATSAQSRSAWLADAAGSSYPPKTQLVVEDSRHRRSSCSSPLCQGDLFRPSWSPDGRTVRYFRREGTVASVTSLYAWTPGAAAPEKLFSTTDVLTDCQPDGEGFLCLREGSTEPRRVVHIDARGQTDTLFDPNPEFRAVTLGRVERLTWRNAFGIDTIGDLVYPVGYRSGERYPLIIVQYNTKGFLRGGTGDEYPIQAFANRGYAVLSFNRPLPYAIVHGASDIPGINRGNLTDFADRRSVQSSLESAVQNLAERGIIDPKKVGITGLSDGGSTVEFGLINSRIFAAAASSSCCWDPTMPATVGPAAAREFAKTGYPRISEPDLTFWKNIALSLNAKSMKTPLLLQLADDEFASALVAYTALRENQSPVDLYVFPDEHHVKWQPAHRLAVYERSIDWFDYWLKEVRPAAPERTADLLHWDALRDEVTPAPEASGARPPQ